MKITMSAKAFENGYLADKYSKYACEEFTINSNPVVSFPFKVENISKEYGYLSWILIDHDSNPVVGFSWIHWLVANAKIETKNQDTVLVKEGFAQEDNKYLRGYNSFISPLASCDDECITLAYAGPTPPDKEHDYTLKVFATEKPLNLNDRFYFNDFYKELSKINYQMAEYTIKARC